jgi:4'-phosphopantetheinyl transferase
MRSAAETHSSELHVWAARLEADAWPGPAGLPPSERRRAARIQRPRSRRRWIAARWALRGVLARYLGQGPAAIELSFGERGKPLLAASGESLRFNLSHSGGLALIAVCDEREVGVDVQRLGPRPADYYAEWTRREAIAKCHGSGLWAPLPDTPVAVTGLDAGEGFAAAVAVAGTELPALRHFEVEPGRPRVSIG